MEKRCARCKKVKPLEAFAKHPKGKFGRNPRCRDCKNQQAREFYVVNKDAILERQRPAKRKAFRRQKYGVTEEQFAAMVAAQGGLCAFGHEPEGGYLMVDHDHLTGRVRGLLCRPCNWAIGFFRDDPERLRRALEYIEEARRLGVTGSLPLGQPSSTQRARHDRRVRLLDRRERMTPF